MKKQVKQIVMTALFMALCCTATMVIHVPSPTQGFVNLGDCMVLLSGWLLGPWYGMAAAGVRCGGSIGDGRPYRRNIRFGRSGAEKWP